MIQLLYQYKFQCHNELKSISLAVTRGITVYKTVMLARKRNHVNRFENLNNKWTINGRNN